MRPSCLARSLSLVRRTEVPAVVMAVCVSLVNGDLSSFGGNLGLTGSPDGVQIPKHVGTAGPVGQHLRAASAGKVRPMRSGPAGSPWRSLQRRVQEALGPADRVGCRPVE